MRAWKHTIAPNIPFSISTSSSTALLYAGPSLHYATESWWATLTWNYQIAGKGVDEPVGQTFAEEQRNLWRLKVGFNF